MGRKKQQSAQSSFILFDVLYEDGTRSSRRRVPADAAEGHDGQANVRTQIMDQDRKIAQMSGNERGPIASISRSAGQ